MRLAIVLLIFGSLQAMAQSKTTNDLSNKYENAFTLFFYQNTLQMINQADNEEFAALIENIEKMKFLRIGKEAHNFTEQDYSQLVSSYQNEAFEELMTMRHEGMDINVFIKEKKGITEGLVVLMEDGESVSVLDIKGSVPLNQIATLASRMSEFN